MAHARRRLRLTVAALAGLLIANWTADDVAAAEIVQSMRGPSLTSDSPEDIQAAADFRRLLSFVAAGLALVCWGVWWVARPPRATS